MKKIYLKMLLFCLIMISLSFVPDNAEYANVNIVRAATATRRSKRADNSLEIVNTRKQLKKAVIRQVIKLNPKIRLLINRRAMKYSFNEYKKLLYDLSENQKYNEIMEHISYWDIDSYNYNNNYYIWEFKPKYTISKAAAKRLLVKIKPVIKTRKELIKQVTKHIKNLDKEYVINVSKKVLAIDNKKAYTKFWDDLYAVPEVSDISNYRLKFDDRYMKYKNYYKLRIKVKYNITKAEIKELNSFVAQWVSENIRPDMTEEQKVRAINDFMVNEYRYTFGDNAPANVSSKTPYPDGKLGKYSVYTCFSLLHGKGGVCDAKAKMFYRLAKKAGIKVIYITGFAGGILHAWNMVKVDGNWYHVDVTWNRGHYDGTGEYEYFARRDYYLKSDATLGQNHTWDAKKYPAANSDYPSVE